jgi:hypothetical protein
MTASELEAKVAALEARVSLLERTLLEVAGRSMQMTGAWRSPLLVELRDVVSAHDTTTDARRPL